MIHILLLKMLDGVLAEFLQRTGYKVSSEVDKSVISQETG